MQTNPTLPGNAEGIQKFRALVKEVHTCMFTTLFEQQQLSSRPMNAATVDDEGNV